MGFVGIGTTKSAFFFPLLYQVFKHQNILTCAYFPIQVDKNTDYLLKKCFPELWGIYVPERVLRMEGQENGFLPFFLARQWRRGVSSNTSPTILRNLLHSIASGAFFFYNGSSSRMAWPKVHLDKMPSIPLTI